MGGALMGHPGKLDDVKAQRICNAVSAGNTRRCAASAAGVGYSTLKVWMQRGRAGEEPYMAFLARLEKADAEAEERHVQNIDTAAASGSWQASAWWLERRRRNTSWRRPVVVQESEADVTQVSSEQLEAAVIAAKRMRERKSANG